MKTVGIDFGTTNSSAAIWQPNGPRVIEMVDGKEILPSCVALTPRGVLTGRAALRQINENARYTFQHIKRYIGRDFSDEFATYQMEEGPDGKVWWKGPDRLWSSAELIAELLKAMLLATETATGSRPDGAVITIPIDFHDPQKRVLEEAAEMAGFEQRPHFYEEPVAAALAFGMDRETFARILVYDWGGGTFDVAILNSKDQSISVRAHGGVRDVGGADIDQLIVDHCARRLSYDGHDISDKPLNLARLRQAAEKTKIDLSSETHSRIYLDHFLATPDGITDFQHELSRETLEDMAEDLVKETVDACRDVMDRAGLKANEIEHVILVGGQTRMPLVDASIKGLLGKSPITGVRQEYAVSLGAAIVGAEIDGLIEPTAKNRLSAASVGLRRDNGNLVVAIPKGAALPAEKTLEITNMTADQEVCSIQVYEGEHTLSWHNTLVIDHAEAVEPSAAGEAIVPVQFARDGEGALTVRVAGQQIYPEGGK